MLNIGMKCLIISKSSQPEFGHPGLARVCKEWNGVGHGGGGE